MRHSSPGQAAAAVLALCMAGPVLYDIGAKAANGDVFPATILVLYLLAGVWIYARYGYRHSRLGAAQRET